MALLHVYVSRRTADLIEKLLLMAIMQTDID
jgi:hypothetical protein